MTINQMFSPVLRLCAANSSWRAGPEIGNSDVTPRFRGCNSFTNRWISLVFCHDLRAVHCCRCYRGLVVCWTSELASVMFVDGIIQLSDLSYVDHEDEDDERTAVRIIIMLACCSHQGAAVGTNIRMPTLVWTLCISS